MHALRRQAQLSLAGAINFRDLGGYHTVDGLSMLLYQAVNGFSHWFGVTPKVTAEQRKILEDDIRAKT